MIQTGRSTLVPRPLVSKSALGLMTLSIISLTLSHPHLPATFPYNSHDARMGDGILDFHRGTVDFLDHHELNPRGGEPKSAHLELATLFQIAVHLNLDGV